MEKFKWCLELLDSVGFKYTMTFNTKKDRDNFEKTLKTKVLRRWRY